MTELRVGQIWKNNRNGFMYQIMDLPLWSDTPTDSMDYEGDLEIWIYMKNITTNKTYVRSIDSFLGINRSGQPRFTFQHVSS